MRFGVVPENVLDSNLPDKELLALVHLSAVDHTKKGWTLASQRMGYQTLTPFTKLVNALEEKGLIKTDGYKVTSFYNQKIEIKEKTKKKNGATQEDHALYHEIQDELGRTLGYKYQWVSTLKELRERGISPDDIKGCAAYIESFYKSSFPDPITGRRLAHFDISKGIDAWIEGGRKESYNKTSKDFSNI